MIYVCPIMVLLGDLLPGSSGAAGSRGHLLQRVRLSAIVGNPEELVAGIMRVT